LAQIAAEQKVNLILLESNYGDGMFTKLFTPILLKFHKYSINEIKNYTQKEKRIIDTLEPVFNQHKLVMDKSLIKRDLAFPISSIR